MNGRTITTLLPPDRRPRRMRVGSWAVDVAGGPSPDRHESHSGPAARLAEELVAAVLGVPREWVRVAGLPPSGRPVAMVRGAAVGTAVSVSHGRGVLAAAFSAQASVGIDVVDPAEAGRHLDPFFTPDELALVPDEEGLLRGLLWSAKEAAYKAARLDVGFSPRAVTVDSLAGNGFEWTVAGPHRRVTGAGGFAWAGRHLVAVAAAPPPSPTIRGATRRPPAVSVPAA